MILSLRRYFYSAFFRRRFLFFSLCLFLGYAVRAQDGEALFKNNCTSCHHINDYFGVGPALKNVQTKHSEEWLLKWVHNSQAMVRAGDPDAVKLFNDNKKTIMTSFSLKEDEIKAIIGYIKTESEKAPPATATPVAGQPSPEEEGKY